MIFSLRSLCLSGERIKAAQVIEPIHEAQLLTYPKLGGWKLDLLINFNVLVLKDGIRRRIL